MYAKPKIHLIIYIRIFTDGEFCNICCYLVCYVKPESFVRIISRKNVISRLSILQKKIWAFSKIIDIFATEKWRFEIKAAE